MSDADANAASAAPETKAEPVADTKPEENTEEAKQEVKTDGAADSKDGKTEDAKDEPKQEVLKTKGQIDYENPKNNRKFDPTQREVSDDPDAIRKQVHFTFVPPSRNQLITP